MLNRTLRHTQQPPSPPTFSLFDAVRLGVGGIPVTLRAGACDLGGRKDALGDRLSDLGPSEHQTGDETDEDGRNTAEGDGSVEEDKSGEGNGELVEGSDHGVGGGRGCTNAPGGAIRDEDGGKTGVDHADVKGVPVLLGEVLGQVLDGPVLSDQGADDKYRDTEGVVVEHSWRDSVSPLPAQCVHSHRATYCPNP